MMLSYLITRFAQINLFSFLADSFSKTSMLSLGYSFVDFFYKQFGPYDYIVIVFSVFCLLFIILSYYDLYKYIIMWGFS